MMKTMRVRFVLVLALAMLIADPAFGQRTWNNSALDNDFANGANWTGWDGGFTGTNQDWRINLTGASRAELNSAVGNVQQDISVGRGTNSSQVGELFVGSSGSLTATRDVYAGSNSANGNGRITVLGTMGVGRDLLVGDALAEGRLFIEGGTVNVTRNMRLGRDGLTDGYGQVTMGADGTGGTLNIDGGGGLFVGQSNRAQNVFTLHSGTVAIASTLNVAHNSGLQGSLIINGGSMSAANAVFAGGNDGTKTATLTVTGGSLTTNSGGYTFGSSNGGATATVNLSDTGTITSATSMSFGFGTGSTANLNMSGGTLNALTSFIGFGQVGNATVTMSDGVINADRMGFANNSGTAVLNMTGGVINLAQNGGTASHSGGLRMQGPGATLNIGGDALVNAQKLYINDGGVINLSGNALLDISGSNDAFATFDFSSGLSDWTTVNGQINFGTMDTAVLRVLGSSENIAGPVNFVDLFNGAIANGVFTHNVTDGIWNVGFDGTYSYVNVTAVPEPSSLALIGFVSIMAAGRRARRR